MDFQSLMEEAKAIQNEKTKKLTKMKEEQKQSEMERQRKFIEKQIQVQRKVPKVNRLKHNFNKSIVENKKQNDLQVNQIKKISKEKAKIPKISRNDVKTVSITTSEIINPKTEHKSKPQHQPEENKISSKPTQVTNKKTTAPKYSELIELAKKNLERKDGNTKTNSNKTPAVPVPGRTKRTSQPITPQKRKLTEDKTTTITKNQMQTPDKHFTSTQEPKITKLKDNKNKPTEDAKPRRQIEQSDFFKKTFEMRETKKPPTPLSRSRPKNFSSLANDQYIDEDDDFIVSDDDDADFDVSAVIKNIFRYDKNKYVDDNDFAADRDMVSSYSQQQFEERRSARIGRQEDINDMLLEEEEVKKAMKKKKSKKLKRLQ